LISALDFSLVQLTITIGIHGSENLINVLPFLLGEKLGSNESKCGLLELGIGSKLTKICKSSHTCIFGNVLLLFFSGLLDPNMLQSLFSRTSLILVLGEKLCDEIFTLI